MSLITALKSIGNDFVFGFIQAMDGEKVSREVFILGNCEEEFPKKPVGRQSADSWSSVSQQSADCRPFAGRQLADRRPTVGRQTADRFYLKYRLPVGRQWRQNFSLQYQSNIKQISDENKEKYQFGDNQLIQYSILWTNIIRIVWLTVRRITNLVWELKG